MIFILVLTLSNGLLECSSFISSASSRKDQNMDSAKKKTKKNSSRRPYVCYPTSWRSTFLQFIFQSGLGCTFRIKINRSKVMRFWVCSLNKSKSCNYPLHRILKQHFSISFTVLSKLHPLLKAWFMTRSCPFMWLHLLVMLSMHCHVT